MHELRVFFCFFSRHWRVAGQLGAGGRYNFIRADDRRSITCSRGSVPAGKVNTDTLRAHRKRLLACRCICFTSHPRTNSHRSEHQLSRSGRTGECRGKGAMLRKEKEKKGMGRNVREHKRSSGLTSDRLFCRVFPALPASNTAALLAALPLPFLSLAISKQTRSPSHTSRAAISGTSRKHSPSHQHSNRRGLLESGAAIQHALSHMFCILPRLSQLYIAPTPTHTHT